MYVVVPTSIVRSYDYFDVIGYTSIVEKSNQAENEYISYVP